MKKIMSYMLIVCLIFSAFGFSALAESDGDGLSAAISAAKSKFTVPEDFNHFSYNSNEKNEVKVWNLYWENDDGSSINMTVDDSGRLQNYYWYDVQIGDKNKKELPLITRQEAQAVAQDCIAKVAPELSGHFKEYENNDVNLYSGEYSFCYYRMENGIPFYDDSVCVNVNYATKEVSQISISWHYDMQFPLADQIISSKEASEILKDDMAVTLTYREKYNRKSTDPVEAYLVYTSSSRYKAVDPFTGEVYSQNYGWSNSGDYAKESAASDTAAAGMGGRDEGSSGYTEEELKKIAETQNLLTAKQADSIIRSNKYLSIDDSYTMGYQTLRESYNEDGKYLWYLRYTGTVTKEDWNPPTVYATVDAETGEILSFYCYNPKEDNTGSVFYSADALGAMAADFLQGNAADKFSHTEINGEPAAQNEENTAYGFSYARVNEGVPFYNNYMNVTVNSTSGKIINYDSNWYSDINFESTANVISEAEAIDRIVAQCAFALKYEMYTTYYYNEENGDKAVEGVGYINTEIPNDQTARLVYSLDSSYPQTVSATSGMLVNYSGEPYTQQEQITYRDISGHWIESQANLLAGVGIGFEGGKLLPDAKVTQKEFLYLLSQTLYLYIPVDTMSDLSNEDSTDAMYDRLVNFGIIQRAEIDPDGNVAKLDAIRFAVRAEGLAKAAELEEIYKTPFTDDDAISNQDKGYCAIAYGLGIVSGNASRKLEPKSEITRAQALSIIYNFLKC